MKDGKENDRKMLLINVFKNNKKGKKKMKIKFKKNQVQAKNAQFKDLSNK